MSDSLGPPASVIQGLNPTVPPSNHSPLLELPTELLIGIVAALDTDNLKKDSRVNAPLLALRL